MAQTIIVQMLHGLLAVVWIGGMIFMDLVLMPSMSAIEPAQRARLIGAVAKRFTIVAWVSVIVLLVTGIVKTPGNMLLDASTRYGSILMIKHILFAVMIGIGLLITFVAAPRMRRAAPRGEERPAPEFLKAQGMIKTLSTVNMVLGIVILVLVGMLKG